jgi:hypothetical protein
VNKIQLSLAVISCCTLIQACSKSPVREREGFVTTGFAALADTATTPSPRDSALARLSADTSKCQYIEGEFNVPEAMELIFGLYDRDIECSKWICEVRERQPFAEKRSRNGYLYTRAADQYVIREGRNGQVLLLTETLSRGGDGWEDCVACAPILGAALFTSIDGAWFVESIKKDIAQIGAWGKLPPSELIAIGPQTWGLRFDYGYTAQGTQIGSMALMSTVDGQFQIIADVHTRFSNEEMFLEGEGEELKYSYNSELTWVAGDNTDIHDMYVYTVGRRPEDGMDGSGRIKPFAETRIYTYKTDQYVLYDSTSMAM